MVDEASMVDLDLMSRLLRAVRPETRLVLLGDVDQLPPIAAGAVFCDLVQIAGPQVAIELKQSYRMDPRDLAGRHLYRIAQGILHSSQDADSERLFGSASKEEETLRVAARASDVTFHGVELLEGDREELLERWFHERVMTPAFREWIGREDFDEATLEAIRTHLASHRILCVTSRDVDRVNEMFRTLHPSRQGEPVMMSVNDDERGLFNGDEGVLLPAGVNFRGNTFDDPELLSRYLSPCYATTVHKTQGSELDHVTLVLPPERDHPLLTRELLYTAMTRARKSVTVVGTRDALLAGIGRSVERTSGIAERLS